jgi:hypothetical protein
MKEGIVGRIILPFQSPLITKEVPVCNFINIRSRNLHKLQRNMILFKIILSGKH